MFEKRAQTPVENRSYAEYYIVFSALLFLGTVWAVWDEVKVRRPWKEYQEEYHALMTAALDSMHLQSLQQVDSSRVLQLNEIVRKAEEGFGTEGYQKLADTKESLQKDLDVETRDWRFARSRSDAAYFQYKKAEEEGGETKALQDEVALHDADAQTHFNRMNDLQAKIDMIDSSLGQYTDAYQKAQVELVSIFKAANSYASKAAKMRDAPVEIRQVILEDYELTPFQEVKGRVDRCQTCHAGWKDDLMQDAPQPYTKHPFPELLAKHNPEKFGCTPCHRGQGPALTEGMAHGPGDPYWETPILHGDDTYATCNSCHFNETVLKYAKPFTRAKQLIIDSGCYGCHEIRGFDDLPKIGPMLNSVGLKDQPDWIYRWVKNPKDYNPHTRMPNFKLSSEQAAAVTAFLLNISKSSTFKLEHPRGSFAGGNAARGKKVFETVGCQACHVTAGFTTVRDSRGTSYDIAPELTRVGSKLGGDWIFDWIKNPRHFNPETRMPNLRLTDAEARDVVAYLLTLKDDRTFEKAPLRLNDTSQVAFGEKTVKEFGCFGCHNIPGTEKEGKVSVDLSDFGRKKYEQMDFGDTHELSLADTVDYRDNADGSVAVKHTWRGWVYGKLKNPRLYQTERIVQKMPVFTFVDGEIKLIRMFLISLSNDQPLPKYQRVYDKRMQDIEAGRRLTMGYNCIQCHNLEDRGGYILAKYEEPAMGPPMLPESQGAKVQEPWLHSFLEGPTTIRPWLKIRMPTFSLTDDEIAKVQRYFLGLSNEDFMIRDYAATPIEAKYLAPGKQLFDTYQCGKCHPSGSVGGAVSADLAPNLEMAHTRLKPEWILQWLHDPQKLQPGTRMPSFFNEGQGPDATVFGGSETEQIKALQAHVWTLGSRRVVASANK
ncbi:MAG TPA: c-type cytochrome [Bacteroidota bacterium]|nr:c-type cytochrome [Bacteroidota bacterium]